MNQPRYLALGSIVLCRFPEFEQPRPGSKYRPAIVVGTHKKKDGTCVALTVMYMTSQKSKVAPRFEIFVDRTADLQEMGLNEPGHIRTQNTATVPYTTD